MAKSPVLGMVDCTWCDGTGKVKIQGAGKRPPPHA